MTNDRIWFTRLLSTWSGFAMNRRNILQQFGLGASCERSILYHEMFIVCQRKLGIAIARVIVMVCSTSVAPSRGVRFSRFSADEVCVFPLTACVIPTHLTRGVELFSLNQDLKRLLLR